MVVLLGLVVVVVGVVGSGAQSAAAQWSAVVVDFEGPGARPSQNAVVDIVEARATLTRSRDFASAAETAGHDLGTDEGLAAAAQSQNVSLVVTGRVTGRNRNARVLVRFRDSDGRELSTVEAGVPSDQSARQRFNRDVTEGFDRAIGTLDERAASDRSGELSDDRAGMGGLDDELASEADEEPSGDDGDVGGGGGGGGGGGTSAPYPFVRGLVGLDGRGRNASFDLENGLRRTYSAFYPMLTLTLELRPFSPSEEVLRGFFFTFDGAAAIGLTSNEELSSGMVVPIETSAYRFGFELGYLYDLDVVELGASLGFVYDAFELAPNNTIPTTAYSSLRIGLIGRLPILDDQLLSGFVEGGLRILMGTGLSPTFAEGSSGVGFDVTGGLRGALDIGLTYAARVGYIGYAPGFSGNGANVDDTASGGFDGGVYFGAQVGWQL
jgi:hypothetical protein